MTESLSEPVSDACTVELTALVHDRPGVLARIANVFYRRGINIVTLDVGPSHVAEHAALRARVGAPSAEVERVAHALRNLVDVVSVEVASTRDSTP